MPTRPFDLARAQAGEPVQFAKPDQTVRSVELLRVLRKSDGSINYLLFIVTKHDGFEHHITRCADGRRYSEGGADQDIVMAPRKCTVWVAIDHRDFCTTWAATSKEAAEEAARRDAWRDGTFSIHAIEIEH